MITRIYGKANSGKSLYALKRLLEYESDICIISLDWPYKLINKWIKKYIENYTIDNGFQISKNTFSNILIKSSNVYLDDFFNYILKVKREKNINTFLIDTFNLISFRNGRSFCTASHLENYKTLHDFSKKENIDFIITDQQRDISLEIIMDEFFEKNNIENTKIVNKCGYILSLQSNGKEFNESIKCFFERSLDEIRDKKIDFILN